ncbi:hypothetical protein ER57_04185 [Smithella sp. SCADC]|jgi:hypothetical protein|nr:hypothetical protein ER57_04185 [Smithella sp. SCADC]
MGRNGLDEKNVRSILEDTLPKLSGKKIGLLRADSGFYGEEIFQYLEEKKGWREPVNYHCLITNLTLPAQQGWNLYKQRADAENRIKELKYDFGFDSFNMKSFYGTEAALNMVMLAYNLMSLFRQVILQEKTQPKLSTLRYRLFAIGGYMVKEGNNRILKLSLAMKRREWFLGLWNKTSLFSMPVSFST